MTAILLAVLVALVLRANPSTAQNDKASVVLTLPESVAVLSTQTVVLSCAAYGTPTPNISWSTTSDKDLSLSSPSVGVNITNTIKNINNTLFAVSVLKLCNVNPSDEGEYSCIASNGVAGCGLASNVSSTPLSIHSTTDAVSFNITSHEMSESSTILNCSVKSQVEIQQPVLVLLQGGTNGQEISSTSTNFTSGHNSLTAIVNLTSMAGEYTCKLSAVSNGITVTASHTIIVTTTIPDPMVTIIPENVIRYEGGKFKLTCRATHGYVNTEVSVTFYWYRGNSPQILPNDEMYSISSQNKQSELTIEQLQSQGNVYKCMAIFSSSQPTVYMSSNSSFMYDITINVTYTVPSDVILMVQSGYTSLNETDDLQITCSSYGYPPPLIYWQRNSQAIIEGSRITISSSTPTEAVHETPVNSTLRISSVLPSDAGGYVCLASNVADTKRSNSTKITVNANDNCIDTPCGANGMCNNLATLNSFICNCSEGYYGVPCAKPKATVARMNVTIVGSPMNTSAILYELVNLTCKATGDRPIVYQWKRDGQILPDRKLSFLIIPEINPEDRGVYKCVVSNNFSSAISQPALVTIKGITQYRLDATLLNDTTKQMLIDALIGPLANDIEKSSYYNVTVISVKEYEEGTTDQVSLIVTVLNNDDRINSTNFPQKLHDSLNQLHSLSVNLYLNSTVVHDACPSQKIKFKDTAIEIKWNETMILQNVEHPCPCQSLTGVNITRKCEGSYSKGAAWTAMDITQCNMTKTSLKLCAASLANEPPEQLSEILVNATSVPDTLLVSEVTVAAVVIEKLTEAAANDSSVRENYLESIDNIIEVDQETITEARASKSILRSLERFSEAVQPNFTDDKPVTFARTNFALQFKQINLTNFAGETFNVDLGSVGEAMNTSGKIDPEALQTLPDPLSNATGSLSVSEAIRNCSSIRLGYSVFVTSSLFPTESENTTVAGIILNLALACPLNESDGLFKVTFQTILPPENTTVVNETCANWKLNAGEFGRWTTDACEIISGPGERPVKCKCSFPAHFGVLFDLSPSEPLIPEALHAITHIFLPLSMLSLLIIIVTYLADKHLRSQPHDQIIINLSISLLGLYSFFLLGGHVNVIKPLCGISAGLLHYFMLVFFSWTAVESVFLFMKLVKVMGTGISHYTLKAGLLAWIAPAFIVVIVGGAGHQYYTNPFFCRADNIPFYVGTIAPIVLIFLFNWTMYIMIMVSIARRLRSAAKVTNTDLSLRQLARTAIVLSVVLGLGWAFGLLQTSVPGDSPHAARITLTVFQVLFSLLVGLQGVLMFGFYGIGNKKVREVWKKWFCWKKNKTKLVIFFSRSTASTSENMKTGISGNTGTSVNDYSEVPEKSVFSTTEFNEEIKLTECAAYGKVGGEKDETDEPKYEQLVEVDLKKEKICGDYEEPISICGNPQEKEETAM